MKESKYLSIDYIIDVLINFKTKYKWIEYRSQGFSNRYKLDQNFNLSAIRYF